MEIICNCAAGEITVGSAAILMLRMVSPTDVEALASVVHASPFPPASE
jgi:hypothetical protein